MGTDCHIVVVGPGSADRLRRAVRLVHELEARWSRFIPDSEISRLNRSGGAPRQVSRETIGLIANATGAWELTDGRFDPTVGRRLNELGYDKPFDQLAGRDSSTQAMSVPAPASPVPVGPAPGCADIEIDHARSSVTFPPGLSFDPGGIGKGYGADLIAADLISDGAWGAMVNLGGDLRVMGTPPTGDAWTIQIIERTISDAVLATVRLNDAGLATSTTMRRRWVADADDSDRDSERHHLINPHTGLPHENGPQLVSVIGGEAWWAEVQATTRASSPTRSSLQQAARQPAPADDHCGISVLPDGSVESFGDFERYEAR